MRTARLLLLMLVGACGGGPCGGPDTPPPDTCDEPMTRTVAGLELGSPAGAFVPWAEGDAIWETTGSQGGRMIGTRLRLVGTDLPGCVPQSTIVRDLGTGAVYAQSSYPIRTYPDGPDARVTKTLWLIQTSGGRLEEGGEIEVEVTGAGQTLVRRLRMAPILTEVTPAAATLAVGERILVALTVTPEVPADEAPYGAVTVDRPDVVTVDGWNPEDGAGFFFFPFGAETHTHGVNALAPGTAEVTYRLGAVAKTVVVTVTEAGPPDGGPVDGGEPDGGVDGALLPDGAATDAAGPDGAADGPAADAAGVDGTP